MVCVQSKRDWLAYFPDDLNAEEGPYAIRWREFKAHYYTNGLATPHTEFGHSNLDPMFL